MGKGICHIIGACDPAAVRFLPKAGDLIIAADGGYSALDELGVIPNFAVGDFDSLGFVPRDTEVLRHPVMKDDTDMMLAVKLGLDREYRDFRLYGGIGGRLDHTLANIQALAYIVNRGGRAVLAGAEHNVTLVKNGRIIFDKHAEGYVSVFAYGGDTTGVTLTGLLYPLNNAVLTCDFPLGVSNRFTGVQSCVEIGSGSAVVVWSGDVDKTVLDIVVK